ncbi:MAG: hypothetical protein FJY85_06950 [Deltaproteobacteria bacterium]|nr:hypothetical protein [Deltaproteobacteria bacterium]
MAVLDSLLAGPASAGAIGLGLLQRPMTGRDAGIINLGRDYTIFMVRCCALRYGIWKPGSDQSEEG